MPDESTVAHLLDALPDDPRHAELRGLLLHGRTEIWDLSLNPELSFVVRELDDYGEPSIFVGGRPSDEAILEAVRRNQDEGMVVAWRENVDHVAGVLPEWRITRAPIYTLASDEFGPGIEPPASVRWLQAEDLQLVDEFPDELQKWLEYAVGTGDSCLASWEGGMPVSFCCAVHPSERWWDVAIDTLPEYQRRGHATRCVRQMIHHMRKRGREPVWCAEEQNAESHGLARRLGFQQVDSLVLFYCAE